MLLVPHNTFFNLSDHLTKLISKIFQGCEAGKNFSMNEDVIKRMKIEPFSIMLDISNDTGFDKMFPVTLRLFDINFNGVMTKFLDMNMLVGRHASTKQLKFNSTGTLFNKFELIWNNVTDLGLSNTNSNIGARNSIKQRAIEKNGNVFASGCP